MTQKQSNNINSNQQSSMSLKSHFIMTKKNQVMSADSSLSFKARFPHLVDTKQQD